MLKAQVLQITLHPFSEFWKCLIYEMIYEICVSFSHREGKSQNMHVQVK